MCLLSRRFAPCRVDRLIWHAGSCNKQRRGVGHIGTHGKAKLWWGGDRFLSCPDHKKYIYTHIYIYVIYYNIFSKGQMKRSILNQGFCFFCVFNASGKGLTHFRKDQLRHWRFDPQKPWEDQLHLAPWAGRQRWHLESTSEQGAVRFRFYEMVSQIGNAIPIESMYGIYANIYHQYTPNVSIYTIHGSYGIGIKYSHADANWTNTGTCWDCWTNNWKIVPCWQSHRHKKITEMRSYKDIIP